MKKAASTTKRTTSKKPKTEGLGVIGELDRYLFGEGRHYQLYHKLGAHPYTYRGQDGYYFAVWAPHAAAVSLSQTAAFTSSSYRDLAWDSSTNSPSPRTRERFYLRLIHMHFRQNTVREPLP